jgi:hypothetical protein
VEGCEILVIGNVIEEIITSTEKWYDNINRFKRPHTRGNNNILRRGKEQHANRSI